LRGSTLNRDLHLWDKLNVLLTGTITDRETKEKLDSVHVRIVDKKSGQEIYNDYTKVGLFQNLMRDNKFNDEMALDIHISKPNYLGKLVHFKTTVTDSGEIVLNQTIDLAIDKIKVGVDVAKVLKLNPIYYDFDKSDIRPDAAIELDKVVEAMVESPAIVIELGSHTDCRGKSKMNQNLSERRAKSAVDYIVSKGIDKSRIYSKGYGESKLLNKCACEGAKKSSCSEEEHQLNRRTEFIIVKM
jgi:outer membrane protein OmpA-like peptidoglycan-associated protein